MAHCGMYHRKAHENVVAPVQGLDHRASFVIALLDHADEDPRGSKLQSRESDSVKAELCVHIIRDVLSIQIIEHDKRIKRYENHMSEFLYVFILYHPRHLQGYADDEIYGRRNDGIYANDKVLQHV